LLAHISAIDAGELADGDAPGEEMALTALGVHDPERLAQLAAALRLGEIAPRALALARQLAERDVSRLYGELEALARETGLGPGVTVASLRAAAIARRTALAA
jgi:hypothetical protein